MMLEVYMTSLPQGVVDAMHDAFAIYGTSKTLPTLSAFLAAGFKRLYDPAYETMFKVQAYTRPYPGGVILTVQGPIKPPELDHRTINLIKSAGYDYYFLVNEPTLGTVWAIHPLNDMTERNTLELRASLDRYVLATEADRRKLAHAMRALVDIIPHPLKADVPLVSRVKRILKARDKGQKRSVDEHLHLLKVAIDRYTREKNEARVGDWLTLVQATLKAMNPKVHQVKLSAANQNLVHRAVTIANTTSTRQMRKRSMIKLLPDWTTPTYQGVQNVKRGHPRPKHIGPARRLAHQKLASVMNSYFSKHALRAPAMPPGQFVDGRQKYLYRGMRASGYFDMAKVQRDGYIEEKGFVALSRAKNVAKEFAGKEGSKGMLVRLDPFTDIPHGTPWLWFDEKTRNATVESTLPHEAEVLLPPGRLVLHPDTKTGKSRVAEYRATFVPLQSPKRGRIGSSFKSPNTPPRPPNAKKNTAPKKSMFGAKLFKAMFGGKAKSNV